MNGGLYIHSAVLAPSSSMCVCVWGCESVWVTEHE